MRKQLRQIGLALVLGAAAAAPLRAEDPLPWTTPLNTFGLPGLIDMPVAQSLPDAEFGGTITTYKDHTLVTLGFQMAPRMMGTFRYVKIARYDNFNRDARFDRSFDVHFQLKEESKWGPAVALGFRDLAGSGIYESEYLVATKSLGSRFKVTGGLGWGRLGSRSSFSNPLGIISPYFDKVRNPKQGTGKLNTGNWFKGEAAFFGGVEYRPTDRLSLRMEYSSDAYLPEVNRGVLAPAASPINVGATYRVGEATDIGLFYIHGTEVGIFANFMLNPKRPSLGMDLGPSPAPLFRRPDPKTDPNAWATSWTANPDAPTLLRDGLQKQLAAIGIKLESLKITADTVRLRVENKAFDMAPQVIGRTARILAGALPASVEYFEIIPIKKGIPLTQINLRRSDLEQLEFEPDASWRSFVRSDRMDPGGRLQPGEMLVPDLYPRFTWGLGPYGTARYFDPDNPFRFDLGAELQAGIHIAPGLSIEGAYRKSIFGNLNEVRRPSNSKLPHVRTDIDQYDKQGTQGFETLTANYMFRPAKDYYGRVTAGYLETMYGGLSAEMLWKPIDSRLGLGIEVNYARKRDFDKGFGFQNYSVWTGHASAYYDFGNDLHAQLDVGRYLARDWGATLIVQREFANGWRIGAFATLTDVPFNKFGEGSFDKGIIVSLPTSWVLGQPNTRYLGTAIRPVTRDGGARLDVRNRLYGVVRDYHDPELQKKWGRFWR